VDEAIQAYLRVSAARGRETERVGPFLATFDPTTEHPFLSYAIPETGAEPTTEEVVALVSAYEHRGRRPRLEYLPRVAPAVEAALVRGGFAVELRPPVLACPAGAAAEPAPPAGVELVAPRTEAEMRGLIDAQHEGFGEPPPGPEAVGRALERVRAGGIAILARDAATGDALGGGVCTAPAAGVTELAGIAVRPAHRRRGIAAAITARLAREAFTAGVRTAFLTPGGDDAGRIYARAGFSPLTEMLHISVPEGT
jgi:GNAT superfamily N-acetyltransferase